MANWGPLSRHPKPKRYRIRGKQPLPWLSPWINLLCWWEHRAHHAWERCHLLGFARVYPARMGESFHIPQWWVSTQSTLRFCYLAASQTCEIPWTGWSNMGRRWGSWSGIFCPQFISSHLPACMVCSIKSSSYKCQPSYSQCQVGMFYFPMV